MKQLTSVVLAATDRRKIMNEDEETLFIDMMKDA